MSDPTRVQRWRERMREEGKEPITVWLVQEEKRRLEDLARTWRCAPSDIMQQALAAYHPGVPVAPTAPAGLEGNGVPVDVSGVLEPLVERLVHREMDPLRRDLQERFETLYQEYLTKMQMALEWLPKTETVTDTVTETNLGGILTPGNITDTDTDSVTDTENGPKIGTGYATDTATDTVTETTPPHRKGGRPPVMRQRILTILAEHPEGLSAQAIKVHLGLESGQNIGNTLQGMRRSDVVRTQGQGQSMRYTLP
jgi:hypothetical protein